MKKLRRLTLTCFLLDLVRLQAIKAPMRYARLPQLLKIMNCYIPLNVAGILSKVCDIENLGVKPTTRKELLKKDIILINNRGQELKVTLWLEKALELENLLKEQTTTTIVLIVCGGIVKTFNGYEDFKGNKVFDKSNMLEGKDPSTDTKLNTAATKKRLRKACTENDADGTNRAHVGNDTSQLEDSDDEEHENNDE
ncbi:hypothetical protein RJ639_001367 [Escallonia herrerae]|uniref:Uncharacterized protein n=1 Tax=Escallonia herrerae TaxID=1293975 RepID=A0AA89BGB9_9ASTE|nr:hypothetical protein RJ639_001367 [Escallonia herrerae]